MCLVHQAPQALYIINATKHPFFSSENRLLICPFNAKHGPLTTPAILYLKLDLGLKAN